MMSSEALIDCEMAGVGALVAGRRRRARAQLRAFTLLLALNTSPARASWFELDTPEVHIVADISVSQARDIVADIGVHRHVVHQLFSDWRLDSAIRPTLFLLDRTTWDGSVKSAPDDVGYTISATDRHVLLVNGHDWSDARSTVLHELTHHYLRENARGHRFPVWYQEGLAEFLSTVHVWRSLTGSAILLGSPPQNSFTLNSPRWIPLARVFAITQQSPEYTARGTAELFYGQSWLLVHYAFLGSRDWSQGLARFLEAYASYRSASQSYAAALPNDHGDFEKALHAYLDAPQYPIVRMPVIASPPLPPEHKISDAAGRIALGRLLVTQFPQTPATLAFVRKTAADAGASSAAAALLGTLYEALDRSGDARGWLQGSCTELQRDADALLFCGDAALIRAARRSALPEAAAEARQFYTRAQLSRPDDIEATVGIANTLPPDPQDSAGPRKDLEAFLERSPESSEIAEALARLEYPVDPSKSLKVLESALLNADDAFTVKRLLRSIRAIENEIAKTGAVPPTDPSK